MKLYFLNLETNNKINYLQFGRAKNITIIAHSAIAAIAPFNYTIPVTGILSKANISVVVNQTNVLQQQQFTVSFVSHSPIIPSDDYSSKNKSTI
jgi:hypothetical protein